MPVRSFLGRLRRSDGLSQDFVERYRNTGRALPATRFFMDRLQSGSFFFTTARRLADEKPEGPAL